MLSTVEALYSQTLKQKALYPNYGGALPSADKSGRRDNPLCGDEVYLYANLEDGRVSQIKHQTQGCLLCKASADLMCGCFSLKTPRYALSLCEQFLDFITCAHDKMGEVGEDLLPICHLFAPVKSHRLRQRCVALPWQTCREILRTWY